jgi:hypothetical protein
MPRNITVTFGDGSTHVYQNAPDDATPDAVAARAAKDFGKAVVSLDGGRGAPAPAPAAPAATADAPAKSAAYQAGADSSLRGLANALQGPTFGFADEIAGAVGGAAKTLVNGKGFRENYRNVRDTVRGASDQAAADNPIFSMVTQGMAAAPTLALSMGANLIKGGGAGWNALRAAAAGAATGGLGGAGASTADTPVGVASDALVKAGTGAVLGGAAAPVGAVLGAVGRNVQQRVSATAAADHARQKVAEALVRDARGTAAQAGGDPAAQALARMRKLGPEARVVDTAGKNSLQLLDTLATLPGKTKDAAELAIRQRQAGRAGRLITAADDALGANGRRLTTTLDDLDAQRRQAAAPLYAQLHATDIAQPSPALINAVAAADQLGATALGRKMSTASQQPFTLDLNTPQSWAVRDLDHVKQGLDTLIEQQIGNTGKLSPLGTKLQGLKQALVNELDQATVDPGTGQSLYQAARAAYAGPSALMSAAQAGQKAITGSESSIKQATAGLSASELDAFRVGAFEALRTKLGNSDGGRTEVLNMWRNPAMRDKLKALFPTERAFREFAATAAGEARLKGLESVGRGSQTAARQFGAGDLDVSAVADAARAAATGNPLAVAGALSTAWNSVKTPERVRDAMGDILLSRDKAQLAGLQDLTTRINNRRASRAIVTGNALSALVPQ